MLQGLAQHANKLKFLLDAHSPTLLTAVGVGGTVVTSVLTGRATFKAANIISQEEQVSLAEWREGETVKPPHEFSKTEKVKLVWKLYIPPVVSGALTIASIITANKISSTRIAALTVAAGVSERAFQEYKDKVIEKLGEKQDEKIRDEVAQDRINANPPRSGEVLIAGSGDVLCYDMLTGRYFHSTVEDLKRAENRINYELVHFMHASLSMFYEEIGLPPTPYTDSVGWNMNNHMEIRLSTVMSTDNRPCIAVDFSKPPIAEYADRHWD
jgi:Family of unknown function (DUF6353)